MTHTFTLIKKRILNKYLPFHDYIPPIRAVKLKAELDTIPEQPLDLEAFAVENK